MGSEFRGLYGLGFRDHAGLSRKGDFFGDFQGVLSLGVMIRSYTISLKLCFNLRLGESLVGLLSSLHLNKG